MFKLKFKDLNEQRKCLNRPEKGVDIAYLLITIDFNQFIGGQKKRFPEYDI